MQPSDPFGWIGSIIDGQFAVEALAGEGAFGVVYRGRHLGFDAPIAVKCLKIPMGLSPEQQDAFLAKFRGEARLLHQLSRRTMGIVQALDIGAAAAPKGPWTPYIVMEWLEGETLEQDLRRRRAESHPPRSLGDAIRLLAPVAAALAVAHDEHVSHRDVKPANLFLARDRMKVLDFGLAKVFAETPSFTEALAETGKAFRAFTPQYGAPEQFSPRFGATGPWTDVYAMALILIELASGQPALSGSDVIQLFVASSDEASRPGLRARGVDAAPEIDAVLGRALAINPAHRFHSLGEMWAALEAAQRTSLLEFARDTMRAPAFEEDGLGRAVPTSESVAIDVPSGYLPALPRPPLLPTQWEPPSSVGQTAPIQERSVSSHERGGPRSPATIALEGGEHRVCTVLLADFSDVTKLSVRLDPEEVKDVVDRCYEAIAESIDRMQGIVEKPVGARMMAIFGLPRSTDHDAERAVVAALAVQAAIPRISLPRAVRPARLTVRIGITTGRVFIGAGSSPRQEFALVGEAVDGAARLQQLAPHGAIVIGRDTHRLVLGRFRVEPLGIVAPGRSSSTSVAPDAVVRADGLPVYRVLGDEPLRHAFAAPHFHGLETRLVGRAAEMQHLRDVVETVFHERRARLVTLVGEPGTGRTRMLADFLASLAAEPGGGPSSGAAAVGAPHGRLFVLEAQCSALTRDRGYGLAAVLIRQRFGIHQADPPEVVLQKLRRGFRWFRRHTVPPVKLPTARETAQAALIKALGPRGPGGRFPHQGLANEDEELDPVSSIGRLLGVADVEEVLARIATILDPRTQPGSIRPFESIAGFEANPGAKGRIVQAVFRLLAFALERTPIVILCDDIQWADNATLELLEELVVRSEGLPLCIVCSARPDLYERKPRWGAGREASARVDVAPLARRHVEEMIRDRLRRVPDLQPETVRVLAERAEGNPRTLEELLHLLVDTGVIETQGDTWRVHEAALGTPALPATVQALVQARLDQLDAEARSVLAQGAVIGSAFWEGAVERLRQAAPQGRSPMSSERLLAELQDLDPPFSVRHEGGVSTAQLLLRLCERQLIRLRSPASFPGEREYVFTEQSTCEVAYEMLSVKVRRKIHLVVADWVEQRAPGDATAALVAHHYERGGDLRAAAAAYARASSYATSIGEVVQAMRHFTRSRELRDESEADEPLAPGA